MTNSRKSKRSLQLDSPARRWLGPAQLRNVLLMATMALIVASLLIPSELAAETGSHVVLVMGWMVLLAVWLLQSGWGRGSDVGIRISWAGIGVGLFCGWYAISAMVMARHGHARPAYNAMWIGLAYGVTFFVVRDLVGRPAMVRAFCAVMVSISVGLAVLGLYQYGYSLPKLRAEYAANPEMTLRRAGIEAPVGSPTRRQFEDRLASTEPIGTFALGNSLAGFLAPWLVLLLGLAASPLSRIWATRRTSAAVLLATVLLLACLVLTKSRSAYLAVIVSLGSFGVIWSLRGRVRARWILLALGVLVASAAGGLYLGAWDRQVLTEAPKSLLYRFQYWRATSALIADHPWFGCGPGNFQQYYTQYKLPEASETVADPHNLLFEIAGTAGLPALAFFLLTGFLLIRPCVGEPSRQVTEGHRPPASRAGDSDSNNPPARGNAVILYVGACVGVLLGFLAGWATEMPPDLALFWIAMPPAVLTVWLLDPWVRYGRLEHWTLLAALMALLVNLLAAGGFSSPGVGQLIWILAALACKPHKTVPPRSSSPRSAVWVRLAGLGAVVLAIACYVIGYAPVLEAKRRLRDASVAERADLVQTACLAAANADRWWAQPPRLLADFCHAQWMANRSRSAIDCFYEAMEQAVRRDAHSSQLHRQCGDWLLEMWGVGHDPTVIAQAAEAYRKAVELYPNSNILHAQLAWTLYQCGNTRRSAQQAEVALRLNQLVPHQELKLASQPLAGRGDDARFPSSMTTEQIMLVLRKLNVGH